MTKVVDVDDRTVTLQIWHTAGQEQFNKILRYIKAEKENGAKLVTGG